MAATHGSQASFWLGTVALPTTTVDLSTFGKTVGASFKRDTAETTTFKSGVKQYIPGLKDATIPFDGPLDAVVDQQMWDLFNTAAIVNFEYYPAGKAAASGTPKFTGSCMVTKYDLSSPVGGSNDFSGEFQVSGAVTRVVQ